MHPQLFSENHTPAPCHHAALLKRAAPLVGILGGLTLPTIFRRLWAGVSLTIPEGALDTAAFYRHDVTAIIMGSLSKLTPRMSPGSDRFCSDKHEVISAARSTEGHPASAEC